MTMHIHTERGKETLEQERRVMAAFHKIFPNYQYVETDKDRDAVNDGIIMNRKTGTIIAVCETKCRSASTQQLVEQWHNEWLVTHKKIKRNAFVAREMRCYFTGLLYLAASDDLLITQLYDGNLDRWLVKYRTAETETQKNNAGGTAIRENAFIDMTDAKRFNVGRLL